MANATNKPNGLTITRDGALKFIISWKVTAKNYSGGQQVRFRAVKRNGKATAWQQADVSSNNKQFTLTASNWNPSTSQEINYVEAEVRGKCQETGKVYDWSAWANKKLSIAAPPRPTVTDTLDDANESTFEWNVNVNNKDAKPFVQVQWQSILKKACKEKDGSKLSWKSSKLGWQTNTGSASGSKTFTESSISSDSYTRWFRIRSRGAGGNSEWRYSKHVYAAPFAAVIKSAKATVGNGRTTVTVKWNAATDAAHPIDQVRIEYAFETPATGLTCPTGNIWSTGTTFQDTSGDNTSQFTVNQTTGADECLFVRVVTIHDERETASAPVIVKKGPLTDPELSSSTVNSTNHKITVVVSHESDVPDSFTAVYFKTQGIKTVVGVIAHSDTTLTAAQCPDWGSHDICIGIQEIQGTYTAKTGADGVTVYAIQANMKSALVWRSGDVPMIPKNVTADAAPDAVGEVIVTWDWSWNDANQAEISWSDNPNAWESTAAPNTYILDRVYEARRRVVGLETGKTWYFAVRLMFTRPDGDTTYGDYSDPIAVNLSSAPNVPILALSNAVVAVDGTIDATWSYSPTDGTNQAYAEICEATVSGSTVTPGAVIATAETAQHCEIKADIWTADSTHYLIVRVTSGSGMVSSWSDPVPVYVAEQLVCTIDSTSLESASVPDGAGGTITVTALLEMPLTATITGAGAGGITTLIIERADEYHMIRPDDSTKDGYAGETIALIRQIGESEITINKEDLIRILDDGATYRLIAIVEDGYGQSDSETIDFEVHWSHQAGIPTATVEIEDGVAKITPTAPASYAAGDVCDIYRLSVDKPQMIVQGGSFGTAYVDPYPALGENAGYRCVCMTKNGDYITADNMPAWVDIIEKFLNNDTGIIDFDGETIEIQFNVKLSSNWSKDFKETRYLGGTVRGDWNPGISRTMTVSTLIETDNTEKMKKMRRLSEYSGLCHVRTQDGSSYTADVQVSNSSGYNSGGQIEEYTLQITRIAPEVLDGLPYSEWVVS